MSGADEASREDRLYELQEALVAALAAGAEIDEAALAARFGVTPTDVAACRRAAELLGDFDPFAAPAGAAAPLPPLPEDYELLGELGRGGMGVVYRVRQRSLAREVALKLVRGDALTDRERVAARFRREATSLARLRHPGVVAIHEVGRVGEHLYYTMDLVAGRDLARRFQERPLTPGQAVEIVTQVASAVAHAHRQGVLHRDLKPGNVLVDDDGRAFVVDFGIARELLDDRSHRTATGELLGTPAAMSPEQARGDHGAISERTDVHGLGLLLFWCLTGRSPFDATTVPALLRQVCEQEAPRADVVRRSVPRDLATICAKALAKAPDDRYPTATAFADDLCRFAAGEPIAARRRGPGARLLRALRRHAVWLGTLVVLLAITLGVVWGAVLPDARRDDRLALARALRDRGEPGAAAQLLDELHGETDDPRVTRAWVQSLLDRAEAERRAGRAGAELDDLLRRAGGAIGGYYRVNRFGAGADSSPRRAARSWVRARALAEDPSEASAARDGIAPWSVLQLRQATLAGDLDAVAAGFNQLAMFGGYDRAIDWLATARQRDEHPAHLSAVGMLATQVLSQTSNLDRDQLAIDPWVALAATGDRQAPELAARLDAVMRDPGRLRRSVWAPGEDALAPLAALVGRGAVSTVAPLAAHLLAHACGLPGTLPAAPPARAELVADLLRFAGESDHPPARRLRARVDLLLRHWPDADADPAWRQSFVDATGADLRDRDAALAWWDERRDADPRSWLAPAVGLDPSELTVERALSRLGAAVDDGVALRRAHDLLLVVADAAGALRGPAPRWHGGGVASEPGQATAPRRELVAAWIEALRAEGGTRYRVRVVLVLFEDAAPAPTLVARHAVELGLGEPLLVDASRSGVLPHAWFTPSVEHAGGDVWGRSRRHDSAVHFRLRGELVPGAGGAALSVRDESMIHLAARQEVRRSLQGEVRIEAGTVASLNHLSGDMPFDGWHRIDALVLATVEPATASERPWSVEQWRTCLAQGIARQTANDPARILHDGVLEAAGFLPVPEARAALRAQVPLRQAEDRVPVSAALAQALLMAGDTDPDLDAAADLYLDWQRARGRATLAFWTRLAASTSDAELRRRAVRRFVSPEEFRFEGSDLSLGIAKGMRRVLATMTDAPAEFADDLAELLDDAPQLGLGWWLWCGWSSLVLGPLVFVLWVLVLAVLWRPSRPRAIRDDFTVRCIIAFWWTGIAARSPVLLGGAWLVLVDWQMMAVTCAAVLLAARRQQHLPRPWRRLMVGMVALTAFLLAARATGHSAWLDEHIVPVRMVGGLLALAGAVGLDLTPQRVRPPSATLLRRRSARSGVDVG